MMSIITRKHLCASTIVSTSYSIQACVLRVKHTLCPEQLTQGTEQLIRILDF